MPEVGKPKISVPMGIAIVVTAYIFDLVIFILAWTIVGLAITWVISIWAYIVFCIWLMLLGSLGFQRGIILAGTMALGCVGVPGWGTSLWIIVSRTIAAEKLASVAPSGAGALAGKLIK